jgi:hypothetical protein
MADCTRRGSCVSSWSSEPIYVGHQIVAAIARGYLDPSVQAKIDQMLAADSDTMTAHDMLAQSTSADRYRGAGHAETASWHFIDIENWTSPTSPQPASAFRRKLIRHRTGPRTTA